MYLFCMSTVRWGGGPVGEEEHEDERRAERGAERRAEKRGDGVDSMLEFPTVCERLSKPWWFLAGPRGVAFRDAVCELCERMFRFLHSLICKL